MTPMEIRLLVPVGRSLHQTSQGAEVPTRLGVDPRRVVAANPEVKSQGWGARFLQAAGSAQVEPWATGEVLRLGEEQHRLQVLGRQENRLSVVMVRAEQRQERRPSVVMARAERRQERRLSVVMAPAEQR